MTLDTFCLVFCNKVSPPLSLIIVFTCMYSSMPFSLLSLLQCVLAVDQSDNLFVWSGSNMLGAAYNPMREVCRDHLLRISLGRFRKPHLHMLKEGDSMSRRLTARLAPAHGDPPEHQVAYFPALSRLDPEQLTALRAKFSFYDPNADPSFRRWFWQIASASSTARKEGCSLCE